VITIEQAVVSCGFACCECGSREVIVRYAAGDPVPTIVHWPRRPRRWWQHVWWRLRPRVRWCPCLSGGVAAARCSMDLLEVLAAYMFVSDYGEPVGHLLAAA